ncbi:putative transporter YfdV [Aquimixticola soesokkakensis]|uniref:Putative transporter YfdV n=1 Tax=Aquimixticola soesokkakensis TaxID=1519096 RepID=A0A1Y5SAW3_9RHOB|nr:AEC family transporter [Aquimixticola soesokkakensis]SLN34936.1 putative transporter YfdV [Aquimixticola soesokkakensis]
MQILLDVVLPVFLVIGFGYVAALRGIFSESAADGLMRFAQNFALPCMLFAGIARVDLGDAFHAPILVSFYTGALASAVVAVLGARFVFKRSGVEAVVVGMVAVFGNSALLGLSITERAYGSDALQWNYAILSIHAPVFYGLGICAMEIVRSSGQGIARGALTRQIGRGIVTNPLVIGIVLGWIVNISGLALPQTLWSAIEMMVRAAIPAALFGLGAVLLRYKPEGDLRLIGYALMCSMLIHPAVAYLLGTQLFHLGTGPLRSLTISAAMAPGVNTYIFANMYGASRRVAASAVLLGTVASILTVWGWLSILP